MLQEFKDIQNRFIQNKYNVPALIDLLNEVVSIFKNLPDEVVGEFKPKSFFVDDGFPIFADLNDDYSEEPEFFSSGQYCHVSKLESITYVISALIELEYGFSVIKSEEYLNSIIDLYANIADSFKDVLDDKTIGYFLTTLIIFALNNKAFVTAKSIYEKNRQYLNSRGLLSHIINCFFKRDDNHFKTDKEYGEYDLFVDYDIVFTNGDIFRQSRKKLFLSFNKLNEQLDEISNFILKLIDDCYNYSDISSSLVSLSSDVKHIFNKDKIDQIQNIFEQAYQNLDNF